MDKEFNINLDELEEPLKKFNLAITDERDVRELLYETILRWYEEDQETFDIVAVEQLKLVDTPAGKYKFIVDLVVRIKKPNAKMVKLGIKEGDLAILDWKTTGLNLSNSYGIKKFAATYNNSFQWKTYLTYFPAEVKLFIYRGISKEIGGETTEVYLKPFEGMADECHTWLKNAKAVLDSQIGSDGPWLKIMPDGCAKFECPYPATCQQGTPAEYLVQIKAKPHQSFSAITTLLTCPERFRRDRLVQGDDADDLGTDAARVGKAFHALIAIIYSKLIKEN